MVLIFTTQKQSGTRPVSGKSWKGHPRAGTRQSEREQNKKGPIRESNPGPPAPKAGIMPLDQSDVAHRCIRKNYILSHYGFSVHGDKSTTKNAYLYDQTTRRTSDQQIGTLHQLASLKSQLCCSSPKSATKNFGSTSSSRDQIRRIQ